MFKINYKIQEADPEVLKKYRLKMFRKRRKNVFLHVGDKVVWRAENLEFVPESFKYNTEYYAKADWGENLAGMPLFLEIEHMTGNGSKIKFKNYYYMHRKEMIEKYEDSEN